jgi:transaldolase
VLAAGEVPAVSEVVFPLDVDNTLVDNDSLVSHFPRRARRGPDPEHISRGAGMNKTEQLRNLRQSIAIGQRTYRAYRELLSSPRWRRLAAAGARPQRLLWASTGTKDPQAPDTLYVEALAAPDTIDTMPEKTLRAYVEHGALRGPMAADGGDAEAVLAHFAQAGIDVDALALQLQRDGAKAFVKSWKELLERIAGKSAALAGAAKENA